MSKKKEPDDCFLTYNVNVRPDGFSADAWDENGELVLQTPTFATVEEVVAQIIIAGDKLANAPVAKKQRPVRKKEK